MSTACCCTQAGKLSQARQLLKTGCEFCPNSEDVWLEAARLQPPDMAKAVLAQGVAANPVSINLWLQVTACQRCTCSALPPTSTYCLQCCKLSSNPCVDWKF